MNGRLTITDVAKHVGVTPRTIMRWEKTGKIKRSKRDWRGWRFYLKEDADGIKKFYESIYDDYSEKNRIIEDLTKSMVVIIMAFSLTMASSIICGSAHASSSATAVRETNSAVDIDLNKLPSVEMAEPSSNEALKYTLGPDDIIEIDVRRHPEFSGKYTVNSEGRIEYKFVGDISVNGLTKDQLKQKLTGILSEYIVDPDVNVQIMAYMSKVFYVV